MYAAILCGLVAVNAYALKVTKVSEVNRPSASQYGAEQASGMTWAGGDLYYAIDDNDKKLYPITLAIDRANGSLTTSGITIGTGVVMSGGNDMEGCAFDPCSGKVWISDESGALVREYDPSTGTLIRSAPVPAIMTKYYGNYSLEALTISGDGRTMWTANEEALTVDGDKSAKSTGSIVRLTRFTRESTYDNWTLAGQWAYLTDPIGTDPWVYSGSVKGRSGVSALAALPDGNLLVLERDLWGDNAWDSTFYNRIYFVDGTGEGGGKATDVARMSSLKEATYVRVKKTALFNEEVGWVNYEGMCIGPRLDDGSILLVLIADGGSCTCKIMTLKLSGLNVRTFEFEESSVGTSSIVGSPYRFVNGVRVDVELKGGQTPATAYTNNNTVCTDVGWEVTGGTPLSGIGALASFTVSGDGVFSWKVLSETVAHTPIVGGDTFEEYDVETDVADGGIDGWMGEGFVKAETPQHDAANCSMPLAEHTKMLSVDGEVVRTYGANATNANQTLDLMITVRRSGEETLKPPTSLTQTCQTAIAADKNGCMNVFTSSGWHKLSETAYENDEWLRVTVSLDYSGHTATVSLDGVECGTYSLLDQSASSVSQLTVAGVCNVDDVMLKVDEEPAAGVVTPLSQIAVSSESEAAGLRVTASPDMAAQAVLAADAAKMSQYCGLFRPVLNKSTMTVSFEMTEEAKASETNKLAAALGGVDLSAVAAGSATATVGNSTPGLYYTLNVGPRLDGMECKPSILGDGSAIEFTLEKQEGAASGFYSIEVSLEKLR